MDLATFSAISLGPQAEIEAELRAERQNLFINV
jgi:hypothetical protein